jgi:hypothetical protein
MYENILVKDHSKNGKSSVSSAWNELRAAQGLVKHDRPRGLASLNQLFRSGRAPDPSLDGRYAGELTALDIAPGLTRVFESLTNSWLPWLGKTFNASDQKGDNIFTRDSYPLARFFNPFYRGFVADGPTTYRGFAFRTYIAPGLVDKDRSVLKIDYDLKENPSLTVRRVLDELVQLSEDLYLGKAHVRWWWGGWQTVAYFTLTGNSMADLPGAT